MRLVLNSFRNITPQFVNKIVLPKRFENTFVEKWVKYWQTLLRDYKDVAVGVVKEVYQKPVKGIAYGIGGYSLYLMAATNPDQEVLMTKLRKYNNDMLMISPTLHNPTSEKYLIYLETCINQNKLRFLSLGICTIVWEDKYDEDDCTVPALCDYTRVRYFDIPTRIVDVGFLNIFWNLRWKMVNFDVNYL